MKIGDEVYVHGYVDEIRNDIIIIRNKGGYFGTILNEIKTKVDPQTSGIIWTEDAIQDEPLSYSITYTSTKP